MKKSFYTTDLVKADEVSPTGSELWIDEFAHHEYRHWMKNDIPHREDKDENGLTLPAIELIDNSELAQYWYINGQQHRSDKDEDGLTLPAVIHPYHKIWFKYGEKHRAELDKDGFPLPALIYTDPDIDPEWVVHGKEYTVDEICSYLNVSEEIRTLMILKYV